MVSRASREGCPSGQEGTVRLGHRARAEISLKRVQLGLDRGHALLDVTAEHRLVSWGWLLEEDAAVAARGSDGPRRWRAGQCRP